jgi:hypothetical protein
MEKISKKLDNDESLISLLHLRKKNYQERVLLILRNKQYHSLGATSGKYEGCFYIVKRTLHSNHDGNKIHT